MGLMKKRYKIKKTVWRWPGDMGWHFVSLDKEMSQDIRGIYKKGFVKIEAKIGKTKWNTSLFPHNENNIYIMSIKKSVRKKEGILEKDIVEIEFNLL